MTFYQCGTKGHFKSDCQMSDDATAQQKKRSAYTSPNKEKTKSLSDLSVTKTITTESIFKNNQSQQQQWHVGKSACQA